MIVKKLPYELNEKELDLFKIAVTTDDHSGTEADVMNDVFTGLLHLWVWSDDDGYDSRVVIIGNVIEYRDGYRDFFVSMLAGTNVMDLQPEVVEEFGKELLAFGCNKMSAFLKINLAKKFGAFNEGSYLSDSVEYVVIGKEV